MVKLYPLRFKPIPREMIWGGNSLMKLYNKSFPEDAKIGESWEISAVNGNISVVDNGHLKGNNLQEMIDVYMGDLVGERVFDRYGTEFPLLVKLIDARDVLSVQVHPDDELSFRRHNSWGKTEMWYVLEAEPGAELISGFNREVTEGILREKLKDGGLLDILNVEKVKPGDVFFIPSGRVHAIGRGIVLAEIQQTSDITYRIYDWDRVDAAGKPRELHVELAMDAIDYNLHDEYRKVVERQRNRAVLLADCEYFTTSSLEFDREISRDYSLIDSFVIHICVQGEYVLDWGSGSLNVEKGQTVMIPALIDEVVLSCIGCTEVMEVYIR